jgi:hypothetical protein
MVNSFDAPSAVKAAIRAAGPSRHVLVADFALRLARLGHITEVRVGVAGGAEATEAVRSVLVELAAPEVLEAAPRETALADAVGAQVEKGISDALESLPRRNRACPVCDRELRQDGRQAQRRVFCSVRCRVRHHRGRAGSKRGQLIALGMQGGDSLR